MRAPARDFWPPRVWPPRSRPGSIPSRSACLRHYRRARTSPWRNGCGPNARTAGLTMSCQVSVLSSVGSCARRARAPWCAYCRTEKRTGCEPSERSSPSRSTGWPHGRRRAGGRQILWPGPPGAIEVPRGERLRLQPQAKLLPQRLGGQRGQWGGDERSAGPTSEDGASVNAYVRDVLDTTHATPPRA
jgi:hypothetical protein